MHNAIEENGTIKGLLPEDAMKYVDAWRAKGMAQQAEFDLHRENHEKPQGEHDHFIMHTTGGEENEHYRSNAQKVDFYNSNPDMKIRKLGKVEKENKNMKNSQQKKYEHIKICKPELKDGHFTHNLESLTKQN